MGKRKGLPISGWVVVDKPAGIGSTTAVAIVRRVFKAQKAGHAGTLDPAASGVLPIALGEATKTIPYVMDGEKVYRFSVKFGFSTTTDDAEGTVLKTSDVIPSDPQILAALPAFVGEIEQVPPQFSAVHINGERAYDLARREVPVELLSRRIRIDSLTMVSRESCDTIAFEVQCGKGTYVRSIARDLAERLGSAGHVTALRRLQCGKFSAQNAISLEYLKSLAHILKETDVLLPVETVLDDIPALALTDPEARLLSNGGFLPGRSCLKEGAVYQAQNNGRLVAIVFVQDGQIRPGRVINQLNEGENDVDYART